MYTSALYGLITLCQYTQERSTRVRSQNGPAERFGVRRMKQQAHHTQVENSIHGMSHSRLTALFPHVRTRPACCSTSMCL